MLRYVLAIGLLLLSVPLALAGVTSQPDPVQGKVLAEKLCTNCKLIEVVGVESKLGKTRLAEITAMFESRKAPKAPKNGSPKEDHLQRARPTREPAAKPHRPHSRNLS